MADTVTAAPAPLQPNPDPTAVADQVNSSPESKEDASKPDKWPFAEQQPIREAQVRNAVNFLSHPNVRGTPMVQRFSFLERKGLTREEIEEAFRRCPDPPTSEATKSLVPSEGKVPAMPTQAQSGGFSQARQVQPAQQYTSAPLKVPPRSGSSWSQLILGAGLIAAAGAGTGYFIQKVLAPKFRIWLRDMMLEEKKAREPKREGQGNGPKLSPLEEAVTAAAAAANAAATAAAEVANTSREVLKMQAEEWQHLRSLIKTLDSKTEELKGTLTTMSKNFHDAQEHPVSAANAHVEDASPYKGTTAKPFQRTSPVEQLQTNLGVRVYQSINGTDREQANGQSTSLSSYASQSEDEPWWCRKKVDVEMTASPKQHGDNTLQVSQVDADLNQEIGRSGSWASMQNRGGPLGRQGWKPPPVPQTVMPGAASAIRYHKPATVEEAKQAFLSEEKEVDLRQPPQFLLPRLPESSSSSLRLQNPAKFDEATPKFVAEDPTKVDEAKPKVFSEEKPPVPQTVMPGGASTVRYQKPATAEEAKGAFVLEEKEVDLRQSPQFVQTGSSSSSMRLQNPGKSDETMPKVVAEDHAKVDEAKPKVLAEERPSPFQQASWQSDFPSSTRLQNHVKGEEAKPMVVAEDPTKVNDEPKLRVVTEEKEITSQTIFELPRAPEITLPRVPEITEVTEI